MLVEFNWIVRHHHLPFLVWVDETQFLSWNQQIDRLTPTTAFLATVNRNGGALLEKVSQ